ncbi:uncharacterized protein LOC134196789 [Corticium candelabrum]|uniref:uncharacterized protein LOC134196789 n=1 Tax=Corticium candelabrum TaxID=121492 RepID=UPI002E269724|nr:uncharacterized protein LOC134196789 [Corticium candelabrum]
MTCAEEVAALEQQLAEAKKRLEVEQMREKELSYRIKEEEEAIVRQKQRKERREKEEQERKKRQAVEDEESVKMLEKLALSEMRLTEVKRAKEAVGMIYKKKLAEINTIDQILISRERKYKQLLEGHVVPAVDVDSPVKTELHSDASHMLVEERRQVMKELLSRRQEELDAALVQHAADAEALKERKRVEMERLSQFRYSHGLNLADDTMNIDMATRLQQTERNAMRTKLRVEKLKKDLELAHQRAQGKSYTYKGELGPSSYKPWQLEDYYMVRSIVLDIIENVIKDATAISWSDSLDAETQELLWETQKRKVEVEMNLHYLMRDARVAAGIITDAVIESECKTIASQFSDLWLSSDSFVSSLIVTAVQDICNTHQDQTSLVRSSYSEMKRRRRKLGDVHRHTQLPFVRIGDNKSQQIEQLDSNEDDITTLDFLHLNPVHLSRDELSEEDEQYKQAEAGYWQNFEVSPLLYHLPDAIGGVSCSSIDSSDRFLALGGESGVIVVMDLHYRPPLPLRIELPTKSSDKSPILQIAWSMDTSRLLSLNNKGIVQLWSISGSYSSNTKKEIADFSVGGGYVPCQMRNLLTLTAQDFVFVEGPFAGSEQSSVSHPTRIAFHPAVTLLGTQNWFVVALSNGDILKVNSNESLIEIRHSKVDTETSESRIGQNLQAELFRGHRCPVSSIGFVHHADQMVSVDRQGHVFLWLYNKSSQTGFGWFVPIRKCRIEMAEQVYKPVAGQSVKTIFSDTKQLAGRKKQTVNQRERARRLAKQMIESLPEPPWHVEQDKEFVIKVYSPADVPASGETFHIVTLHHSDGELSEYATQTYKPTKNAATKLINAENVTTILSLFDCVAPHLTVVIFSVESFTLHSVRIDIPVSQQQHDECMANHVCSLAISRVLDVCCSDYIFANVCGKLLGYSLATGSLLLAGRLEPLFVRGCELTGKVGMVSKQLFVKISHQPACMLLVGTMKGSSSLHLFQLHDTNSEQSRRYVWEASQQGNLPAARRFLHPFQARSNHWTTDGS